MPYGNPGNVNRLGRSDDLECIPMTVPDPPESAAQRRETVRRRGAADPADDRRGVGVTWAHTRMEDVRIHRCRLHTNVITVLPRPRRECLVAGKHHTGSRDEFRNLARVFAARHQRLALASLLDEIAGRQIDRVVEVVDDRHTCPLEDSQRHRVAARQQIAVYDDHVETAGAQEPREPCNGPGGSSSDAAGTRRRSGVIEALSRA